MLEYVHPGLLLIAGAAVLAVLPGKWRVYLTLLLPAVALAVVIMLPDGVPMGMPAPNAAASGSGTRKASRAPA